MWVSPADKEKKDLHSKSFFSLSAGDEGIEPPTKVLETSIIPFN